MERQAIRAVAAAVEYIEKRLDQRPCLAEIAGAANYSKYHLHRVFAGAMGVTLCQYLRRRQLTQAALLLATTRLPILEIAQGAGYDSQRAFSAAFAALYKQTPGRFRNEGRYYPVQLPMFPDSGPTGRALELSAAGSGDIPGWMGLAARVVGCFPCFEEVSHRRELERAIRGGSALVLRDGEMVAGAIAFSPESGEVGFFAVHPQYRGLGAGKILLGSAERRVGSERRLTVTTFRAGDRTDTGQRAAYQSLGFLPGEPLIQYGYPVQRLVLPGGDNNA